jgi:hypothetical protein
MTLYHFKALSLDKQYRSLLLNSVCLASRDTEEHYIQLFQLDDFYVEVYFEKNCEKIIRSRSFQDTNELYPYLEKTE